MKENRANITDIYLSVCPPVSLPACPSVCHSSMKSIIYTCSDGNYHFVTSVKSSDSQYLHIQLSSLNSLGTFLLSFSSALTTLKFSCLESPRSSKIKLSVVTIIAPTKVKSSMRNKNNDWNSKRINQQTNIIE